MEVAIVLSAPMPKRPFSVGFTVSIRDDLHTLAKTAYPKLFDACTQDGTFHTTCGQWIGTYRGNAAALSELALCLESLANADPSPEDVKSLIDAYTPKP